MDVSANTKSEFKQLIEYIHTKSVKHIKDSKPKNAQHLKKILPIHRIILIK
jgi:hypothetical protein